MGSGARFKAHRKRKCEGVACLQCLTRCLRAAENCLCWKSTALKEKKLRGGGDDLSQLGGPGIVPAICLALLGLAWLPADGKLVREAHKQKQGSPSSPQGHCLFMRYKKGGKCSAGETGEGDGEWGGWG